MTETVTLTYAQAAIRSGAEYGDVWPSVAEADREALAAWFVREPGLPAADMPRHRIEPALAASAAPECERPLKEIAGRPRKETRTTYLSHVACTVCGGEEFVPGACPTCANCGQSSGGCG